LKHFVLILIIFSILLSCKTQQRIRLKELYEKIGDEVMGNNIYDTSKGPSLASTKKIIKKEDEKKDRTKSRFFYGMKTRRAYARKGKDPKKREYELFFVLRKPVPINPYVTDIYWYHLKKRQIINGPIDERDKKYAKIIHGPYIRRQGRKVLEEGIFYVGTKHGRWERYDRNFILLDKKRFYKGWPTDAEISYYDLNQQKPKEVIPIQWGRKEGNYYYFAENGTLLTTGVYKDNIKIGIWTEYHSAKRKKKETQYPKDPYSTVEPFILKEYDAKGKVYYDFRKDGPKIDSTAAPESKN